MVNQSCWNWNWSSEVNIMDDDEINDEIDELGDLFSDLPEENTEINTDVDEVPEESPEDSEEEETMDDIVETTIPDEEGTNIPFHPDVMQELSNFIGTEELDAIAKFIMPEYDEEGEIVSPLVTSPQAPDSIKFVRSILGGNTADLLNKVADLRGTTLNDMVKVVELPEDLNRIDILNDAIGGARFIQMFDAQGNDITSVLGLDLDDIGQLKVDKVFRGSTMTALDNGEGQWSPDSMGKAVSPPFQEYYNLISQRETRKQRVDTLQWLRKLITRLNSVFGFDDYRQLEAFMAAWLMKNATCRLSGIPGTGKTTVINCAATLMGNSYGFHINKTYLATDSTMEKYPLNYTGNHTLPDSTMIYADNSMVSNAHMVDVAPSGQQYNVLYNDQRNESIYRNWNGWRFRDWQPTAPGTVRLSGSYSFDFNFLRRFEPAYENLGLPAIDDDLLSKAPMTPEKFHKVLNNCWEVEVAQDFDLKAHNKGQSMAHWDPSSEGFKEAKKSGKTRMMVKPIQYFGRDGSVTAFNNNTGPTYGPYKMRLRFPEIDSAVMEDGFKHITNLATFIGVTGQKGLFSDTGRNEGYWLRHLMCHWFVDDRTNSDRGLFDISVEMLREIGVAKIDFDKRPDEVLYGLEIRAVEAVNQAGETVSTYEFEPVPREIVTQPVKFFNEANRSQSGVEDAVLGLIAEKLVEYRGKTFKSPDFVAWMDTNPHQKGNDLAFTDRIDMELLFKSVSLGGRYDQLSNKFGGAGGKEPQLILVDYLTKDGNDPNSFRPMRIVNLFNLWKTVGKDMKFTSPGSTFDGLRDISVISVLFSQIFAKRPASITFGDNAYNYTFAEDDNLNLYESPLLDYSTTTNTNTSDKGTTSPVLTDDANLIFGSMDAGQGQLPIVFTRVLGFRFTNSLVKLSQAFAFLRGKDFVSRQEILDAVPYVIAHRMGRAKAGAKDMEGNNKGLDGNRLGYVNEQEFIREFIVKGYLEGKIGDVSPFNEDNNNLLDNVDYFYNHCRTMMDSVPNVWEYESLVMEPIYRNILEGDVDDITPIHWHIATMVVEEERKGRGRTVMRDYSKSFAGPRGTPLITQAPANYHEMYSNYEFMILNPAPNGEPTAWDYYRLRGLVSREPNLFTHDRERLLTMISGEMRSTVGAEGLQLRNDIGSVSVIPFPQAVSSGRMRYYPEGDESPWPRPDQVYWPVYDDAQGAWGTLIGFGAAETYDNSQVASPLSVQNDFSLAAANQSLRVSGRYLQSAGVTSLSKYDVASTLKKFYDNFTPYVGAGWDMEDTFPNADVKNSNAGKAITFESWIKKAQEFLKRKIRDPAGDAYNDIYACFELDHAPISVPQAALRGVKGDDKLRLWLRLSYVGSNVTETGADLVDILFTVGISSALATTSKNNLGLLAQGADFTIVPVTEDKQYTQRYYSNGASQPGYKTNTALVDSGNMMSSDRNYYNNLFAESLQ
jgi:hypothetical protein